MNKSLAFFFFCFSFLVFFPFAARSPDLLTLWVPSMTKKNKVNLVYLLELETKSYCGSTNDLQRRLRQHRSEIKGGARYTRRNKKSRAQFEYVCSISGFPDRRLCNQLEYAMHHVRKWGKFRAWRRTLIPRLSPQDQVRFRRFSGIRFRILTLVYLLHQERFLPRCVHLTPNLRLTLTIGPNKSHLLPENFLELLPHNVSLVHS